MLKQIRKYSLGLYAVLFVVNLVLLFALPDLPHHGNHHALQGHIVPWVVAIVMGALALVFLAPTQKISKVDARKMLIFGTMLVLNLLMIVFSILDIAAIRANHPMSTIVFVVAPALTLAVYGTRK